jgi:hypothetical protein
MSMCTHHVYSREPAFSPAHSWGVYSKKNGIRSPSMAAKQRSEESEEQNNDNNNNEII